MEFWESNYRVPDGFSFEDDCLFGLDKEGGPLQVTTTPIMATAFSRTVDNAAWNLITKFMDRDGRTHKVNIPASDLLGGGLSAIRQLVDRGLGLCPGMEKQLVFFLQCSHPSTRLLRITNSGWVDGLNVFVLPNRVFGQSLGEKISYEPEQNSKTAQSIRSEGSLKDWQTDVASVAKGNPVLVFCILSALTGPLLKVLGLDGGGFHIYGHSSRGKTTALQVAASVWGGGCDPAIDSAHSFAQRWNTSANGLEAIAAVHSDLLIALDELGTYNGADLGIDIYTMAGGQGKATLTSSRKMREIRTWRGNILSTGEKSMRQAIEENGQTAKAGQLLRIIDLQVENVLEAPPAGITAAEFANQLKKACSTRYGTAGPAFVETLVEYMEWDPRQTTETLRDHLEKCANELTSEDARPEQARAFRRFAALQVAGELAIDFGVLPLQTEDVHQAVFLVRDLWLGEHRTIDDTGRALQKLQNFLIRNHSSLPSTRDAEARASNAKAFRNPQNSWFLFTDEQLSAATGGGNVKDVVRELRQKNLLAVHETGRLKVKQKLASAGGQWARFYAVTGDILSAELGSEDPETEKSEAVELTSIEEPWELE
ncbi:DUF927 domain-containing protein [Geobacter anodireducens]|uniref:DUF927 domain-containing protein n=1 Tax=Geobacter soli TaxID=1510391 RepID=A0A0C1QPG6_9BACT|nr:DUF927 domain-containing protein [Geobacter soli]KIE42472.1 hypothetical protein SE37_07420 [Geobacter soli]